MEHECQLDRENKGMPKKVPVARLGSMHYFPSELAQAFSISERRRKETQRLSGVGFWELNHLSGKLYWSEEIYAIYDLDPGSVTPDYNLFFSLIFDADKSAVHASFQASVSSGEEYNIRYRVKAGEDVKWIEARGVTYYTANGEPERSIGTAQDISEIKAQQAKIEHMAYHDMLTGLANREFFLAELRASLSAAHGRNVNIAVLFIDLDFFKSINDSHGHDIGNEVLVGVAQKLQGLSGNGALFARIGGDEFAGMLFGNDADEIGLAVCEIKDSIDAVYAASGFKLKLTASIGVTLYPQDDEDGDVLLRHADQAMYMAKELGKSRIEYFDTERFRSISSQRRFLQDIESAISSNQFEIYYQPRVKLSDRRLAGAEALLRWHRPDGAVPPSIIVAAVKDTPLEWALDSWLIRNVLAHCKIFKNSGLDGPFSININPRSLVNPDFPGVLHSLMSEMGVDGEDIEIEILEVESITDFDAARETLRQCQAWGVSFSLDDFGTGYSSLTYFHAFPISKLKIDQRFVTTINSDPYSLTLVKSILALANANNTPVVAEGVESDSIAETLAQLRCQFAQGYGIARPMPMSEYLDLARVWQEDQHWVIGYK